MDYYERINNARDNYDRFLEIIKPLCTEEQFFFACTGRSGYVGCTELDINLSWLSRLRARLSIIKSAIECLLCRCVPNIRNGKGIVEIQCQNDKWLAQKLEIPLLKIEKRIDLSVNIIIRIKTLKDCKRVFGLMMKHAVFSSDHITYIMGSIVRGAHVYTSIKFYDISLIVTQRDCYPIEMALITKANEYKIPTIKIDYFPIVGPYYSHKISCKFYYCPNDISKHFIKKHVHYTDITIIENRGFPYWDMLNEYIIEKSKQVISVTFFTQYGAETGIFGNLSPAYYIEELIACLDDTYQLNIKVHPLENVLKYKKYESERVRVFAHGEVNNWALVASSSICLAVSSFALLQAKHICKSSYFLNYNSYAIKDFEFNLLRDTICMITSREKLQIALAKDRNQDSNKEYLELFNPTFPNACVELKKLIDNLS